MPGKVIDDTRYKNEVAGFRIEASGTDIYLSWDGGYVAIQLPIAPQNAKDLAHAILEATEWFEKRPQKEAVGGGV